MKEIKKYLSLYDLLLANGGKKIAAVMAAAITAEGVLLYIMMGKETLYYENLFARNAALPLIIGFFALAAVMCNPMKQNKSNLNYTLYRMNLSPKALYFVEIIHLCLVFAAFWGLSLMLLYGFGLYFTQNVSEAANREMGVLLAFARQHELWFLLPVGNLSIAVRNIAGILALSAAIARANFFQRAGKLRLVALLLVLYLFTRAFYTGINEVQANMLSAAAMLIVGVFSILSVMSTEKEAEEVSI